MRVTMIYPENQVGTGMSKMQPNSPLVSVVMGTYNGGKYLREQLESIYGQTYKKIEVIVSDDCSTDNTVEILKEFSRDHGLKCYINEKNLGLVKNFEKVLSLAKGDYIALADQDDIWYPGKIELLLNNIGPSSLIHSGVHVIDGLGRPHGDAFVVSEYSRDHTEKVNFSDFLETAWVLGCTSLIERSLLEKCLPFPDGVMFHDWWLTMAAIKLGHGIKYIHEPTIKYRQYGENTAFKFFMDISWHKKRFDFYKLLSSKFHVQLSPEEKERLNAIAHQNAVQYILKGIQLNRDELVQQFMDENRDLITVPFIKELISATTTKIVSDHGVPIAEQKTVGYFANDSAYQLIQKLRTKIYSPVSLKDKVISKSYRRIFKPFILTPLLKIYLAFHPNSRT
jgi:glycosyltransferase involved in cell wall biosynthesis